MVRLSRKQRSLLILSSVLLVVSILLAILGTSRCTKGDPPVVTTAGDPAMTTTSQPSGTSAARLIEGVEAVTATADDFDPKTNFDALTEDRPFAYPVCHGSVQLYVASGPGKPASPLPVLPTGRLAAEGPPAKNTFAGVVGEPVGWVVPPIIVPTIPILIPAPTLLPSSIIVISEPAAGTSLTAGDPYVLHWTVSSGRKYTSEVLLSTDGGRMYTSLARGIMGSDNSYAMTVPDKVSSKCVFKVNVSVDAVLLGYSLSPVFSIAPRPSPTPTVSPSPSPTPTPAVSADLHYGLAESAFVSSDGDPVRWFLMEFQMEGAKRILWQVSQIPYSCIPGADPLNPPGLLVDGEFANGKKEFAIDFGAVAQAFSLPLAGSPGGSEIKNGGAVFRKAAELVLPEQTQRLLYVRAIALDNAGKVVGKPGDGVPVVFGKRGLDLAYASLANLPETAQPILSAAISEKPYQDLSIKGLPVISGTANVRAMVTKVPVESVEIDFQVATEPFKATTEDHFRNPAGIVYRSDANNLVYTEVTRYYTIPMSDFAPTADELGKNTVKYYIRTVCYLPGGEAGTSYPVTTKTGVLYYTGDLMILLMENLESAMTLPTEEVVVKSNVPSVSFERYDPVQWEAAQAGEYFEVTRPIQAEEICFSLKNNKTGDFLVPYSLYLKLYPNTTRAQYQAIVDRMLPVGASFHLTITEGDWWETFWSDFWGLLTEIYDSIRDAYNGLKESIIVFAADRFAFLGEDAQSLIEFAIRRLVDVGLAAVGLPPSLPNFEALASAGLDYCLEEALMAASTQLGVPLDQIPENVRDQITSELKAQFENLKSMNHANPLDVDYLKPSTSAMYRPAYVDVKVSNYTGKTSLPGTLTITFYSVENASYSLYEYKKLAIPPLTNGDSTFIRVFLKEKIDWSNSYSKQKYDQYYWGNKGDCLFTVKAEFIQPDVNQAAKEQGAVGKDPMMKDVFVYDRSGAYTFTAISPPCNDIYPQMGTWTN